MRIVIGLLIAFFIVMGTVPADAQTDTKEEPSWQWPESRWRAAVEKVRAGQPFASRNMAGRGESRCGAFF